MSILNFLTLSASAEPIKHVFNDDESIAISISVHPVTVAEQIAMTAINEYVGKVYGGNTGVLVSMYGLMFIRSRKDPDAFNACLENPKSSKLTDLIETDFQEMIQSRTPAKLLVDVFNLCMGIKPEEAEEVPEVEPSETMAGKL